MTKTHPCSDGGEASEGDSEAEEDGCSVGGNLDEDFEGVHLDWDHAAGVTGAVLQQLRVLWLLFFVILFLSVILVKIVLVKFRPSIKYT